MQTVLHIPTPRAFNFWRTVFSHGWCSLPPFGFDKERRCLTRTVELPSGTLVDCSMIADRFSIAATVTHARPLKENARKGIIAQIRSCVRLDEDFAPFYQALRPHKEYKWIAATRSGRLLRAPTVFEDVVKMLFTTNCSWSLTESMVANLTNELGTSSFTGKRSFPGATAIAGVTEHFVRTKIRAGYRSPFLLAFAEQVASGQLDVESWRTFEGPTSELFDKVRSVKGIGEYAAGNLLRLVGRYDYLALDSWVRATFAKIHHGGRRVSDRTIERFYRPYEQWRGLVFWLEMTRDWFDRKFPLHVD